MTTTTVTPKAQYKDLYSLIGPVPMILANNAESHLETNEPLYEALHKYNEDYYNNMTIAEFEDWGFKLPEDFAYPKDQTVEDMRMHDDELDEKAHEFICEADYVDIYQTFITDKSGAELFSDYGYPTWYNEDMDLHFVGITHYGTAWSLVMNEQYPIKNHDYYLTNEALEAKWKAEHK